MSDGLTSLDTASSLASILTQIQQPKQTSTASLSTSSTNPSGSAFSVESDANPGTASDGASLLASGATSTQISSSTLAALSQLQTVSGQSGSGTTASQSNSNSTDTDQTAANTLLNDATGTALTQAQYAVQMSQLMQQNYNF